MPIIGTGIDIIEISRIDRAVNRSSRFLDRVFTDREISYFKETGNKPCHIAGTFAAKEAVLKALGTGLKEMSWKDIEITRDSMGKPSVTLYKNAEIIALSIGIRQIHISISHGRDHAIAGAIAEGRE